MRRFSRRRFVKRNVWQLVLSGVAAIGLLFLFVNAQPVDPRMHNALISDLREMQKRDIELGEVVLQQHYQLYHNYDEVTAIMRRMQMIATGLAFHQENGSLPDTPEVMRELSEMQQQITLKAGKLEEFKSHNAVIKNSFLYLPRQVNAVLERLPEAQHDLFELLIRDLLLITLDQGESARVALKQHTEQLDRFIPGLPGHAKPAARAVVQHARSILENESDIAESIELLSFHGKGGMGAKLEQLYLDHYRDQQRTATTYRLLLLLLAAMLMLVYAIYSYFRMRERGEQLRIAAAAFETQEGIMIIDPDRSIIRVNNAFTQLTGYTPEEAIGQTPDLLKSGRHDDEFFRNRWEILNREGYWQGEIWNRNKSGKIFPAWLTTTAVNDENGNITHYVTVFSDITLRKEAEEQIHQLAFYDPLTSLPNRRLLVDRLNHTMASGTRNVDHGAILFIDLDNFKTLNDTRGHDVGDQLLIEVARRLQLCVRGGDTVARLGGDEFIVMLEGLGGEAEQAATQARAAGEKIREALGKTYSLGDVEYHSSCSVGISLFHAQDITVDDLLKRADTAMYEAKGAGRNTLRFFDPSMQAALETRASLEVDLRAAISRQQFLLHFQVQVNAAGRAVGAEVLLRWMHHERGMVFPGDFIAVAEETGLILPLGQWVLEEACAQIKAWESTPQLSELQIAVNVSARQFHQPDFTDQVRKALSISDVDPGKLKIELTESVVLDDISDTAEKMRELKMIGVRFSMDDFGTGYSSLAYLTRLPLDQLKIDQSFVRNIGINSNDDVIVQTIIGMADSLEMEAIAEGVETEGQREFLELAGCNVYQGYLFSRPVPQGEFENLVLQQFS